MDSMSKCKNVIYFTCSWYCAVKKTISQCSRKYVIEYWWIKKESQRKTTIYVKQRVNKRVILMPDALCYVQLVCSSDKSKVGHWEFENIHRKNVGCVRLKIIVRDASFAKWRFWWRWNANHINYTNQSWNDTVNSQSA